MENTLKFLKEKGWGGNKGSIRQFSRTICSGQTGVELRYLLKFFFYLLFLFFKNFLYVGVFVCLGTCGGWRSTLGVILYEPSTFIFLTWSLIDLDFPEKTRLASQQVHLPRVRGGWTRCDPRLTLAWSII